VDFSDLLTALPYTPPCPNVLLFDHLNLFRISYFEFFLASRWNDY
jgi:hypothetical protein